MNSQLTQSRSNVSPIYLILFVSATFYLNRPCLYCSFLLLVLVFSLYDFRCDWFEPQDTLGLSLSKLLALKAPQSLQDLAQETVSLAASTMNSSVVAVARSGLDSLARRITTEGQSGISLSQWLREGLAKKEWRIPCIDVAVRL